MNGLRNRIDLIVYDFDGVMTDNRVLVFEDGTEAVVVNRADGLGVDLLRTLGIEQLILSTETSPVVRKRAEKLRLKCIHGSGDKRTDLAAYCRDRGIDPVRVLFVGNDLNDEGAMRMAGFSVAPADAHPTIRGLASHVTSASGGGGVVRELADLFQVELDG